MNYQQAIERIQDRLRSRHMKLYVYKSRTYIKIEGLRGNQAYTIIIERKGGIRLFVDENYYPVQKLYGNYRTGENFHKIMRVIR